MLSFILVDVIVFIYDHVLLELVGDMENYLQLVTVAGVLIFGV